MGLYITAAYWFNASTSFANPAVAIARGFTDTFAGIRPLDLPGFILAQLVGAFVAVRVAGWLLYGEVSRSAPPDRRALSPCVKPLAELAMTMIEFRAIDKANVDAIIALELRHEQERLVASNAKSLAQALVHQDDE